MQKLKDHLLRLDARALGLFRIAMGVVLIGDLLRRWTWVTELYSNQGVLPNHNHLFNLRETGRVWSILHAFSTPGEASFAFTVILLFYVLFLVGWGTRAFHILSLVALVSLTARNILLENAGNYLAIALLAFTVFLPCGRRFSVDALRASLRERDEKSSADLNDRSALAASPDRADHGVGWSPVSLAALAVLVQLALVYLTTALRQNGAAWKDGTALYYGIHVERLVSPVGVALRGAPVGLLRGLSFFVRYAELAIPALILVPVARRPLRWAAAALMVAHGLVLGLLFDLGLFAWTLVAAAPLVLSPEVWDALVARGKRRPVARTVVFDADCGVCLLLSRILARLDAYEHLTFQGNDDLAHEGERRLLRRGRDGQLGALTLPSEVTDELAASTIVVVDERGKVTTKSSAVAAIVSVLPAGRPVAFVIRALRPLLDPIYDAIAKRRLAISASLGLGACGVPLEAGGLAEAPVTASPAKRMLFRATGALREIAVAVVFFAMLTQTGHENHVPGLASLPQGRVLSGVAAWPRMLARWDVLAPEPPREDGVLVIDAQTRAGASVDPITGREPELDPGAMRGTGLGQLWGDYLERIHEKEWEPFQRAFRDWLAKGGPRFDAPPDEQLTGLDAYWVSAVTPPPGAPREGEPTKDRIFSHLRGGRANVQGLPLVRPGLALPRR